MKTSDKKQSKKNQSASRPILIRFLSSGQQTQNTQKTQKTQKTKRGIIEEEKNQFKYSSTDKCLLLGKKIHHDAFALMAMINRMPNSVDLVIKADHCNWGLFIRTSYPQVNMTRSKLHQDVTRLNKFS